MAEHAALRVLLVEDNPEEIVLLRHVVPVVGGLELVHVAETADAAEAWLASAEARVRPVQLVLTDLKLPGRSGNELAWSLRGDPRFRHLPVLVWSGSDAPTDIAEAYRNGAACYLVKPIGVPALKELLGAIAAFWGRYPRYPAA